jgi:predicted ATPase
LAEQLLSLGQCSDDPALCLQGHRALGDTLYALGEFAPALTHLEQGIALYNAQQHRTHAFLYGQDPGVGCLSYAAMTLWVLGYPEQALQRSHASLALAHELSHPFSLAHTLNFAVTVHGWCREWDIAQAHAKALLALATEQGFAQYVARGTYGRGWTLAMQGQVKEGITQFHQGLAALRATGVGQVTGTLTMLAQAYGPGGYIAEGLAALAEARAAVVKTADGRHWEGEIYRLTGDLLLRQAVPDEHQAETYFHQALDIARRQQARSWELRAAMSLCRLWQRQGKRAAARELLAPVYGWFTEGFDTADLQDARALLEELG